MTTASHNENNKETITSKKSNYLSFNEAREFVRSLKLQGKDEWEKYVKEKRNPEGIPTRPDFTYRNEGWISWRDFLGTDFLPFPKAREYARSLGLNSLVEWLKYSNDKGHPKGIPRRPNKVYKNEGWNGWGDFLGTDFLPFPKAREYARSLGLNSSDEWKKLSKEKGHPKGIPHGPEKIYKNKGWNGWEDFLGTDFLPFPKAKEYARSLGLNSSDEWEKLSKEKGHPKGIPYSPYKVYKNEGWNGWGDFLGNGTVASQYTGWSIEKVKELLRSMIETKVIYEWPEARLYPVLLTKGVLNLDPKNKHTNFFKNLIKTVKTDEGKRIIEEYAYSENKDPPDLSNTPTSENDEMRFHLHQMKN